MTRLIDADALTDKVDKYIYRITRASNRKLKVGESAILADIKAHIELSPTIDAEPHWIPCSERMPETTDEVLVTYIVNGNKKRRFVQTSTWYDNEEEGYWSSPWDEYLVPNTKIEVLAWMPLPKPYEVKE